MDALSPRLKTILDKVHTCECLADIGSDHGYLISQAVVSGKARHGIAVELNRDPFEQTRRTVAMQNLVHVVDVRLGNGLEPLKVGEADSVCIAGMGGRTIRSILEAGVEKLNRVKQLVLQPNVDVKELRQFLLSNDFSIADESLVQDGEIIYQVVKAEPGTEPNTYSSLELEYGRHNLKRCEPLLKKLLLRDIAHLHKILTQLSNGSGEAVLQKKQEIKSKISLLKQALVFL